MIATDSQFLRLWQPGVFLLEPTSGKETVAQPDWDWDIRLRAVGLDVASPPTPETPISIFHQEKKGKFGEICRSLEDGIKLDYLCLAQSQLVAAVRNHDRELRTGLHAGIFALVTRASEPAKEDGSNVFILSIKPGQCSRTGSCQGKRFCASCTRRFLVVPYDFNEEWELQARCNLFLFPVLPGM